jgi:hypothetical protein
MVAIALRKATTSVAETVRGNPNNWQEYDPADYNVGAEELANQLREELGGEYSTNVNAAHKVVVHRL